MSEPESLKSILQRYTISAISSYVTRSPLGGMQYKIFLHFREQVCSREIVFTDRRKFNSARLNLEKILTS